MPPLLLALGPRDTPGQVPLDLKRMFIGDEPPLFLVEIALRSALVFAFTLFALRFLGKRGVAQLSLVEVTIILGLGSAVGDPMFQADVPLSHALVVISAIVLLYRGFTALVRRNEPFEQFMEGRTRCLVTDGVLELDELARDRLSTEKLFELLRLAGITQLGEVKRAYLEQSGALSVFAAPPAEVRSGLPILPPWDIAAPVRIAAGSLSQGSSEIACCACGHRHPSTAGTALPVCPRCKHDAWTEASAGPIGATKA